MKLKSLLLCGLAAVAFSGCQEDNLGFSARQIFDAAYKRNLEEKIGTIDPNQSWDFSSYGRAAAVTETRSVVREDYVPVPVDDYGFYEVDKETLDWMEEQIPEYLNNQHRTKQFTLTWKEGSVFEIIPIYQGLGGLHWSLFVEVNGEEYFLWSKSQRMEYIPQCEACKGTGVAADHLCATCNGNKTVSCPKKDNAASHNHEWAWKRWELCDEGDEGAIHCNIGTRKGYKQCQLCQTNHVAGSYGGWVRKCITCGGDGNVTCETCDGEGYLAENKDNKCSVCDGTGSSGVWKSFKDANGNLDLGNDANTLTAKGVRAQPICTNDLFKDLDIADGTPINFYLKVTGPDRNSEEWWYILDNYFAHIGEAVQTADDNLICILNCPTPKNVPANYQSYLVGVEDSNELGSDFDINDIVFLVVGDVPPIVYEDGEREEVISKRYLIEDLTGEKFDFDFNDIVVDVKQTTKTYYKISTDAETGNKIWELDDTKAAETTQEATVRWICGTIPFQVQVGDTKFGWVSDPMKQQQTGVQLMAEGSSNIDTSEFDADQKNPGYQPMFRENTCTKQITGWDPAANNISVVIYWDGSTVTSDPNAAWINTFPERGSVPFMIATDIYEKPNWMDEGVDITESEWWQNNYVATHLPVADVK